MNIQHRRRVANLIISEFDARRRAIRRDPTIEEMEAIKADTLKKAKLTQKIAKLESLKKTVSELQTELSRALKAIDDLPKGRRWSDRRSYYGPSNCDCHEPHEKILDRIAQDMWSLNHSVEETLDKLHEEERTLLAQVEVAQSEEDVKAILASAGLVK